MISYTSSSMENVKCENVRHVQNNVTIVSNSWICQQFNCKHLLIVSNGGIIWFNLKTPEFFSRWLGTSFLWNLFWSKIFVSLFCNEDLLYFFTRVTSWQCGLKIMWERSCSENIQKTNLQQFLLQWWKL